MGSDHPDDRRTCRSHLVGSGTSTLRSFRAGHHPRDRVLISVERGNAPAEFVLVSALVVALVLGALQVVVVGYVRHALTSAAAGGARVGSVIDATAVDAVSHTRGLIESSLSPQYSGQIVATRSSALGVPTLEVRVLAPYPALGIWSVGGMMEVSAHSPLDYAR